MNLLLCGFGAFAFGQFAKLLIIRAKPFAKLLFAVAGAFGIALVIYRFKAHDLLPYTAAGTGLAIVLHRFNRVLILIGDWLIRLIKSTIR